MISGIEFQRIKKEVKSFFQNIILNKNLKEIFGEIPVVGFLPDGEDYTLTAESNRYELKFLIYTSY